MKRSTKFVKINILIQNKRATEMSLGEMYQFLISLCHNYLLTFKWNIVISKKHIFLSSIHLVVQRSETCINSNRNKFLTVTLIKMCARFYVYPWFNKYLSIVIQLLFIRSYCFLQGACRDAPHYADDDEFIELLKEMNRTGHNETNCTLTQLLTEHGQLTESGLLIATNIQLKDFETVLTPEDVDLVITARNYCVPIANHYSGQCVAEKFTLCFEYKMCAMVKSQ